MIIRATIPDANVLAAFLFFLLLCRPANSIVAEYTRNTAIDPSCPIELMDATKAERRLGFSASGSGGEFNLSMPNSEPNKNANQPTRFTVAWRNKSPKPVRTATVLWNHLDANEEVVDQSASPVGEGRPPLKPGRKSSQDFFGSVKPSVTGFSVRVVAIQFEDGTTWRPAGPQGLREPTRPPASAASKPIEGNSIRSASPTEIQGDAARVSPVMSTPLESQVETNHLESPSRATVLQRAEQGDSEAQFELGMQYLSGEGVIQDFVEAYVWLNLAASRGHMLARAERERLTAKMTPEALAEGQKLSRAWVPKPSTP